MSHFLRILLDHFRNSKRSTMSLAYSQIFFLFFASWVEKKDSSGQNFGQYSARHFWLSDPHFWDFAKVWKIVSNFCFNHSILWRLFCGLEGEVLEFLQRFCDAIYMSHLETLSTFLSGVQLSLDSVPNRDIEHFSKVDFCMLIFLQYFLIS